MPTNDHQSFITWALILVSICLVAGISYVYTNRNKSITGIFTLGAIAVIAFIRLFTFIDIKIHSHFIGGVTESQISYVATGPGWQQLWYAWHIWLLPVLFVIICMGAIIVALWYYLKHPTASPQIITPIPSLTPQKPRTLPTSSVNRLNSFMIVEAAKKEAQTANQKLAEALLTNAAYEIQLADLNAKIQELTQGQQSTTNISSDELAQLKTALAMKEKENAYLTDQLSERTQEVTQLQQVLEDLLEENSEENKDEPT